MNKMDEEGMEKRTGKNSEDSGLNENMCENHNEDPQWRDELVLEQNGGMIYGINDNPPLQVAVVCALQV